MGAWVLASALRVVLRLPWRIARALVLEHLLAGHCCWEKRLTGESFLQGDVDAVMR